MIASGDHHRLHLAHGVRILGVAATSNSSHGWPAIFMLFAHGALFMLRTPLVTMLPWSQTNMYGSVLLTVLTFEALLFTISIAFILLAMAK